MVMNMKPSTGPSSRKRKNLDDNWSVSVKLDMSGNLYRSLKPKAIMVMN